MIGTHLYWVNGSWPGKLALAARPRGGDWLEDEMINWKRMGVDVVLSLLTAEEEDDLGLGNEREVAGRSGMAFLNLPIPDRDVPNSETELTGILESLNENLSSSRNVVIHCRQGVGRSGLVAACLLASKGLNPESAVQQISVARGLAIPETQEQRDWINHYVAVLSKTK